MHLSGLRIWGGGELEGWIRNLGGAWIGNSWGGGWIRNLGALDYKFRGGYIKNPGGGGVVPNPVGV